MSSKETIKKELAKLSLDCNAVIEWLDKNDQRLKVPFGQMYQAWYTKACKAVEFLAPDRASEFRSYYEVDPKRKEYSVGSYAIQDFIKGFEPSDHPAVHFDAKTLVKLRLFNQLHILESVESRIDSVLSNVEAMLMAGFVDEELAAARKLSQVNLRAAGALAGSFWRGIYSGSPLGMV
jgi:hypothetical protein